MLIFVKNVFIWVFGLPCEFPLLEDWLYYVKYL